MELLGLHEQQRGRKEGGIRQKSAFLIVRQVEREAFRLLLQAFISFFTPWFIFHGKETFLASNISGHTQENVVQGTLAHDKLFWGKILVAFFFQHYSHCFTFFESLLSDAHGSFPCPFWQTYQVVCSQDLLQKIDICSTKSLKYKTKQNPTNMSLLIYPNFPIYISEMLQKCCFQKNYLELGLGGT